LAGETEAGAVEVTGRLNAGTVGSVGSGVICAVGASPELTGRCCVAAGRGGTAGVCPGDPAWPGVIDCEARLSDPSGTDGAANFGGAPLAAAGVAGVAEAEEDEAAWTGAVSAGTCGRGGRCEPIACWGSRGVRGM
jgi:hypothetical protein